jgi:mannose-6-phosphate isomerase-like protein (cupin superfamily)
VREDRPDRFETTQLPTAPTVAAPDGSAVRVLLAARGGSLAHFELPAGAVAVPVRHRTVDELWYVVSGRGWMWRREGEREQVVELAAGTCLSIPAGTSFQFRAAGGEPLRVLGVTLPPWPGAGEAELVDGVWTPTISSGPS